MASVAPWEGGGVWEGRRAAVGPLSSQEAKALRPGVRAEGLRYHRAGSHRSRVSYCGPCPGEDKTVTGFGRTSENHLVANINECGKEAGNDLVSYRNWTPG